MSFPVKSRNPAQASETLFLGSKKAYRPKRLFSRTVSFQPFMRKPNFNDLIRPRIHKYLNACPPAVSGQGGHNQTFTVAVALVWGFCLPRDEALEYLNSYNLRCQPPWTDQELEHKIDSAIAACNKDWKSGKAIKPPGYLRCYNERGGS